MGVENANGIHELNADAPLGTESISEGDNHIRVIKHAIKKTFPNVKGEVTASHTDLNNIGDTSQSIDSLEADVARLDGEFNTLESTVYNAIANKYEGNVASCYYNTAFLDQGIQQGLVYKHNIASITASGANGTQINFANQLDDWTDDLSAHYAFNITPITLTGKPIIINVVAPTSNYLTFFAYELNNGVWDPMPAQRTSFSMIVIDMFAGQP
jgi:sRNA-binding regulator protein Hfq